MDSRQRCLHSEVAEQPSRHCRTLLEIISEALTLRDAKCAKKGLQRFSGAAGWHPENKRPCVRAYHIHCMLGAAGGCLSDGSARSTGAQAASHVRRAPATTVAAASAPSAPTAVVASREGPFSWLPAFADVTSVGFLPHSFAGAERSICQTLNLQVTQVAWCLSTQQAADWCCSLAGTTFVGPEQHAGYLPGGRPPLPPPRPATVVSCSGFTNSSSSGAW